MRLAELQVVDLALIERARLDFAAGLNVLTGETGAGKSLLIDALALVLGARADTGLVRSGAQAARVEALFDRLPEPLICSREVSATGRSTARLDDAAVTAARLSETAGPLVEIHGQHEQQRLLEPSWQRDLLDAFGGHAELRRCVAEAVGEWRANRTALASLARDPREVGRRMELLEHEVDEIDGAALQPGEGEAIQRELQGAAHAAQMARLVSELDERLRGEHGGAREQLVRSGRDLLELARLESRFTPLVERVDGLAAEVDDVAVEARRLLGDLELDPRRAEALEARLGSIYALERKYGPDEAAVLAHAAAARVELERLRGIEGERARRAADDARLEAAAVAAALELTAARRAAATRLAHDASAALADLGMRDAALEVRLEPATLEAHGADSVVFTIAPNPGEPPMPLARIASGGELSRVSLAVKRALSAVDATPTLVFDEIDAGIGGRSADPVGRSLWRLARDHEVLCVTHLAQIAAYADAHFQISKHERDGRTITEVRRLDPEERVEELALMLGGAHSGEAARNSARELLARAARLRDGDA